MARRTVKRLVAALALAGFVSPALADPISAAVAIFTTVAQVSVWIKAALLIGMMAYGDAKTRRERRAMEAQARAQYNSSLVDRNVTLLRANPPARHVYGRCTTGGDIVAVFTTDKTGYNDNNQPYTKPDAYKHIVVEFAHHQCQAMHDIQVDGKSIALSGVDVNGWSQATEFSRTRRAVRQVTLAAGASVTFDYPVVSAGGSMIAAYFGGSLNSFGNMGTTPTYTLTNGNKTLTNTSAQQATFSVAIEEVVSSVRVAYKLGTSTQVADTYLTTLLPTKWTTNHRLRGRCFAVVTLDLEDKRFQSSPPQITADISGKLLFDPRTSTTAWSDNNALCGRDYLLNVCKVPASMIDDSTVITAANACGSNVNNKKRINGTLTTVVKPKYTFNGTVTTEDSRESVLDAIADSMGGWISQSAKWAMDAGTWTAPVMTLNDDDLDGAISVVQGGTPMDSLFNGVRGQFVPAGTAVPIDFTPYKNAAFVTADGRNRWKNVNFPFTDDEFIATFLARILTERARNGMVIRYPAKLKAWPLRIGERVTVNSTEYGFSAKTFRVTDWQFAPDAQGSPVVLTLQEDAASAYDLIDEVNADPTPNTGLPNPFDVASLPAVSGLALLSDQTTIRRQSDGAAMPRVKVSWTLYTGPYVTDGSGYIYVKWQRLGRDAASAWNTERLPGNSTSTFIEGVTDGDIVIVGVWAENGVGGASSPAWDKVTAAGKTAVPSDVAGFTAVPVPGAINYTWTDCTDVDYEDTELRVGSTWASATRIFKGKASAYAYPQSAPASITVLAKHFDRWGNESATVASASASSLSLNDTRNYDFTNGADGWTNIASVTDDSTASGGKVGNITSISVYAYPAMVPIDPSRRYRVTFRLKVSGGTGGTFYAGVITKNSSGSFISNSGGATYNYCAAGGLTIAADGAWHVYSGEAGGGEQPLPSASPDFGKFWAGSVFAAPLVFSYTGFSGTLVVDYATIEDITDTASLGSSIPTTNDANCSQVGNRILKVSGGNAWNAGIKSKSAHKGGAFVQQTITPGMMATLPVHVSGLNDNPTTTNFTDINFAFYIGAGASNGVDIVEEGTTVASAVTTAADGDVFLITYDGYKARYYKNGSMLREVASVNSNAFYFDCSIWRENTFIDQVQFGPMSQVSGLDTPQLVNGATYGSAAEETTVTVADTSSFTGNITIDCTDTSYTTDGTTKLLVVAEVIVSFRQTGGTLPDHLRFTLTPRSNGVAQTAHAQGPIFLRDVGHTPDWNTANVSFHYSYLATPTSGSKPYDATVLISARDSGGNELGTATNALIQVTHSIVIMEFKR